MITVSIICVGKLKERYWLDACEEYLKRLKLFCKCSVIEVKEEKINDNPSISRIENIIFEEGKRILSKIPKDAFVISMCIEGKQMDSNSLAKHIESISIDGFSNIVFIIGGSWGLSQQVKERSLLRLSMSKMTFPHQMARVMVLEQIYRIFHILNNGKYHK